jgi:hypothetical protein
MKYEPKSRRMFLQGLGGALLSIPFLESLTPREAWGQTQTPIKRYLTISSPFHIGHNRNWFPKMTTLSNPLAIPGSPHMGSYDRLSTLIGNRPGLSRIINSSMTPFLDKMMLYKGLDIPSQGYHAGSAYLGDLSEFAQHGTLPGNPVNVESIDRFLANHPKFDANQRRAVRIGNWGRSVEKNSQGGYTAIGPLAWTAIDAYNILFNNGTYPEAGAPPQVHSRRDILSRVLEDYTRTRNGRQIGQSDRLLLDSVMDKLSTLQSGLSVQAIASCRHVGQDATPANNLGDFRMDNTLNLRNYISLIEAIFLCDISRSVAMGINMNESYDNLGLSNYHDNVSHRISEFVNGVPNWKYIGDIYSDKMTKLVAPLATRLDNILDPANGKSFLHNGMMHVSVESVYPHRQANIPALTIGSFNGALPTGYMVNYCDPSREFTFEGVTNGGPFDDSRTAIGDPETDNHSYDYPGIPYQRFLVTLLQAAGLAPADYERNDLNQHFQNITDGRYGSQNNGITRMGGYGLASYHTPPPGAFDRSGQTNGEVYHHNFRLWRYNYHHFKDTLPLPPGTV